MKLTHFFLLLFLFSIALLVFLKPQSYANISEKNVPQLEIEDFTLYEINTNGVQSVVSGTIGWQYETHYEVQKAHFVQNKNKLGEHIYADKGVFEKDTAYLDDNVRYFRDDGLSFESDHAVYNTKQEQLNVPEKFVLTQNKNVIYGSDLHYNSQTGWMRANKIDANYFIEEKK